MQHYELGDKPAPPSDMDVNLSGDTLLTVTVVEDGDSLTMTVPVNVPEGDGPFPVVIGAGSFGNNVGSLPDGIFTSRDIATVQFNVGDISSDTHGGNRTGHFYNLYSTDIGKMAGWAWGVSRIIDALEQTPELNLDTSRVAVTGCSFAGKIALFSGAFDERIALTIAQEPGGGGAAAWRVSDALRYQVEGLNSTNGSWFRRTFIPLFGSQPETLPYDHHELMGMVAPRALLVLNNPSIDWLAAESADVSNAAAQEVWTAMGISDRFGYSIVNGSHCQLPASQRPAVEAFVEKFLLGNEEADTDVAVSPYDTDLTPWITWNNVELAAASPDRGPTTGPAGLSQNHPNPFNSTTTIEYVVDQPSHVDLKIYNALGQLVNALVDGWQPSGRQTVVWDGNDDAGSSLPAGIYFSRMIAGSVTSTRTMVYVK